jgi:hypothetical protein
MKGICTLHSPPALRPHLHIHQSAEQRRLFRSVTWNLVRRHILQHFTVCWKLTLSLSTTQARYHWVYRGRPLPGRLLRQLPLRLRGNRAHRLHQPGLLRRRSTPSTRHGRRYPRVHRNSHGASILYTPSNQWACPRDSPARYSFPDHAEPHRGDRCRLHYQCLYRLYLGHRRPNILRGARGRRQCQRDDLRKRGADVHRLYNDRLLEHRSPRQWFVRVAGLCSHPLSRG